MLRKYREESASKVHQWFEKDSSLLSSLLPTAGTLPTSSSLIGEDRQGITGTGAMKKVLSGIWSKLTAPEAKDPAGGGQRHRQQQQQRANLVGIETNNIRAPVLPTDEIVMLWREEIMPQFKDRIKFASIRSNPDFLAPIAARKMHFCFSSGH